MAWVYSSFSGLLVVFGLIGVSMTLWVTDELISGSWPQRFVETVGFAFIVAAVIGVTIETTFTHRIAQNVFEVAFGYLLHPDLRNEVRWIYSIRCIASEYKHEYELSALPEDPNKLLVKETITRTVESLTEQEESYEPSLGIQEWFHVHRSSILSVTCSVGDKRLTLEGGDFDLHPNHRDLPILHADTKHTVGVTKERKATLVWVTEEVREWNDQSYSFFTLPSKNPFVRVQVPLELDYEVTFANPNQGELQDLGAGRHRLEALLLPEQAIRLRWWRKADMETYKAEASTKPVSP